MRNRIVFGLLLGAASLLVLDALAARAGLVDGVRPDLAAGMPWVASRAAGVTAFLALSLDVVFGLFVSTGAADRAIPRARSVEVHRALSAAALALTAFHALALLADRFVRFDALDVLVPFLTPHRRLAVGLGVLAAYAAAAVHASFGLRQTIGPKNWRRLHYLSFFVYASALAHGLLAGSDASLPGMRALYAASAAVVLVLLLRRVLHRRRGAAVVPLARSGPASRTP